MRRYGTLLCLVAMACGRSGFEGRQVDASTADAQEELDAPPGDGALVPSVCGDPSTIICDDFEQREDPVGAWQGANEAGGVVRISTTNPRRGTRSLLVDLTNQGSARAFVYTYVAAPTYVKMTYHLRFDELPQRSLNLPALQLLSPTRGLNAIPNFSTTNGLQIFASHREGNTELRFVTAPGRALPIGRWFPVTMTFDLATDPVTLTASIDGVSVTPPIDGPFFRDSLDVTEVLVHIGTGYSEPGGTGTQYQVDDVAVFSAP